ncbi:hypothetical protein H5J25_04980 [Sphingomonas aliaeris]|uniref:Uncharacterized protein n=1 Tax=Sphingomonas aliaeris TaxID=2759526 RepID=A0A974NW26_9SPHN|nr:hypothetical protein [Sphingomonas aliaeris]QQV78089.1 hypothetical protein H5J25_04980 [Sphingomonas aliaeris]
MSRTPHNTPTSACAEAGEVMLDGPDGLAVSLTPDAAAKSATAIADAAREARTQTRSPKASSDL